PALLLECGVLLALVRWSLAPDPRLRTLCLAALLLALGLLAHAMLACTLVGGLAPPAWRRDRLPRDRRLLLPPLAFALGLAPLFVLGYAADHPETYLLVLLPGTSLWLAAGSAWLLAQPRGARLAGWLPAASLALPLALFLTNYAALDLRGDARARDYGLRAL